MADITDLIAAEHARICRLFGALDDAARLTADAESTGCCPRWALETVWARLAGLLDLHAEAEYEICYFAVFGRDTDWAGGLDDAVGSLNDIHHAVTEARLLTVGSRAWWRAVDASRQAGARHICQLEAGALADFRRHTSQRFRDDLGRQWMAFVAALRRDLAADDESVPQMPSLRSWQRLW
jgi:hypothetical protein